MPNLADRIEKLERRLLKPRIDFYSRIQSTVLSNFSDNDLDLLESAQWAIEQRRPLTAPESAVMRTLHVALEAECQRAGFRSIQDCRAGRVAKSTISERGC